MEREPRKQTFWYRTWYLNSQHFVTKSKFVFFSSGTLDQQSGEPPPCSSRTGNVKVKSVQPLKED